MDGSASLRLVSGGAISGGTLSGSGTVILNAGQTLTLQAAAIQRNLSSVGTINWTSGGLALSGTMTFGNAGTFISNSTAPTLTGSGLHLMNNSGLLVHTASGSSNYDYYVNNTGTILSSAGTLKPDWRWNVCGRDDYGVDGSDRCAARVAIHYDRRDV